MATTKKLMGTTAVGGADLLAIEDVFSTYLYTGNGSAQTITNGIDLAGEGGLVWIKSRTTAGHNNRLFDTERGVTKNLITNLTAAELTNSDTLTAFNGDGFTLGADTTLQVNGSGSSYASWTWRKAPRWFDVVTYTGNGTLVTLQHSLGVAPGCVMVKRTDAAGDWVVYHRSTGLNPKALYTRLNSSSASFGNTNVWNNADPTATEFYIGPATSLTNVSGATYVAYLFAHDPLGPSGDGSDGLIACGSFTAGSSTAIDLGWEPQWVMIKRTDSSTGGDWYMYDTMRGFTSNSGTNGDSNYIFANTSAAEVTGGNRIQLKPYGFDSTANLFSGGNYIYIAIRRGPMRQPTSGTEVFDVALGTGTYTHTTGFPVDLAIQATRASTIIHRPYDRLRGGGLYLETSSTGSDQGGGTASFDNNTGYTNSASTLSAVDWMFRRAPGFFDVVVWNVDGTGDQTIQHNLGVVPEMVISKNRNSSDTTWGAWWVGHNGLTGWDSAEENDRHALKLNSNAASGQQGYHRDFTDTSIRMLGPASGGYTTTDSTIAYLFATVPGVSKVGSYTGNGSSQTIDCGFTSGARFVLIKATNVTGDWNVYDTARGIVSGNDPYLALNTTSAENTSWDLVDPASSGFIVNNNNSAPAAGEVNANNVSYIYLAIA